MRKEIVAHPLRGSGCNLCREILCRDGEGKTARGEHEEQYAAMDQILYVSACDAPVDHVSDDDRHEELENGLEHFEERRENSLPQISLYIGKKTFHTPTSLRQNCGCSFAECGSRGGSSADATMLRSLWPFSHFQQDGPLQTCSVYSSLYNDSTTALSREIQAPSIEKSRMLHCLCTDSALFLHGENHCIMTSILTRRFLLRKNSVTFNILNFSI